MKQLISVILFFCLSNLIFGQENSSTLEGVVTFKASKNIYVRFAETEAIDIGDTLYFNNNGILSPCMTVSKKSSSSCICLKLEDCEIEIDDKVIYQKTILIKEVSEPEEKIELIDTDRAQEVVNETEEKVVASKKLFKQRIRARASAATYSNLSNEENDDRHRTMLRFSLNADNINDSRLSLETYVNYRKNFIQGELPADYQTSFFNIYNLAATYDIDSSLSISFGRKINRKISSIGPVDGLQVDKYFRNFYVGGIAGFKPDITGFEFNSDLYEFGGYIGHYTTNKTLYTMTTVGVLEQHNGGPVDRRYTYLQHSSTLWRKLSFFTSAEVDIYDKINGVISSDPRLTNLFVSTRYRMSRKLSFSLSYDARKRIIFYETLRTDVERLLADDEQRQGIRGRINFRPFKYINTSASYSKRFQSDNQNKSNNMNASISHSRMPMISGRFSVNINTNESNYLKSRILSFRYFKIINQEKITRRLLLSKDKI